MTTKKTTTKKAKKPAKETAPAATPPNDEAQAAAAAEAEKAQETARAAKPVLVIVGPNGAAGRIIFNRVVYDGRTPQPMARADFERLRALYDLQEVKE